MTFQAIVIDVVKARADETRSLTLDGQFFLRRGAKIYLRLSEDRSVWLSADPIWLSADPIWLSAEIYYSTRLSPELRPQVRTHLSKQSNFILSGMLTGIPRQY